MTRLKKRNNYTLSTEAQKIVDKIDPYKKSGFVSEAIEQKHGFDKFHEALSTNVAIQHHVNMIKLDFNQKVSTVVGELLFTATESGNFNISLQPGDKIIRP